MNFERAHEPKDVDLSAASRGVWLVKVPKYLSEKWKLSSGNAEVGKLKITKSKLTGQKPEVLFTLAENLLDKEEKASVPSSHRFVMTGVGNQNLSILSQLPIHASAESAAGATKEVVSERLAVEGKVTQRAECRPIVDDKYLTHKKMQWEASNKPKREVKQLDAVVQSYKPRSVHEHNDDRGKKKNEDKRSRDDKDKVMNMLFGEFEKHQYYNIKDLVRITKQPLPYLKEILKEMCTYNMKAPHKNMWELKPEFRHYKTQGDT